MYAFRLELENSREHTPLKKKANIEFELDSKSTTRNLNVVVKTKIDTKALR